MRLKKLTVGGFKSFADKTDITFDAPITCIVGPNGCGKSNIVDAIKWVLGEQSAKSLRGGAMMDVIFNGSSSRKPSGLASVALTFDNTDRKLALDFDTVSVTRRLYRDGSSEYLLNAKRCRLRDVRELFMDTGVGTDAYSIIEQGKVDVLLQANPQQRREIFEEAAGISKFKARKLETTRKLERTEQNLGLASQRLEDTQRRLRSVKTQASRARSYQEHSSKLRQLQLTHILAEYHKLQVEYQQITEQFEQASADRHAASRQLQDHEQRLDDAQLEHQSIVSQQKQVEHDRLQQQSLKQQADQRKQFAQSSLEDLRRRIQADENRRDDLNQRAEQLKQELDQRKTQVQQLIATRAETDTYLETQQDQHRRYSHELNEKRNALEDEKAGLVGLMRQAAQVHNEIQSIEVFENGLASARDKLDQRADHIGQELEQLLSRRDDTQQTRTEVQTLLAAQGTQLEKHTARASQLDNEQQQLTQRLTAAKEQRSALDSRRTVLQEMQDKQEGIADPVKAILARKNAAQQIGTSANAGLFGFIRGLLAEAIETDPDQPDHARIIEAALGDYQQALMIDHLSDVCGDGSTHPNEAIGALAGRVTFLPMDQVPTQDNHDPEESADNHEYKCAVGLVRYPESISRVMGRLLGDTLIVPDLSAAARHRARYGDRYRYVTHLGELLEHDGRVTAGPADSGRGAGGGLISRRSELTRLKRQIDELNRGIATDQDHLARLSDRAAHIEKVNQELRQSIYEANTDRVELTSRLENIHNQISRLEREQPVLVAEIEQIHRQLQDADQKRETHQKQTHDLEADSTARRQSVSKLEEAIAQITESVEASHETIVSIRVEAGKIAEQLGAAQQNARQIEIAGADIDRQRHVVNEQLGQHSKRIDELGQAVFDAEKQIQYSQVRLKELQVREDLARHRLQKADDELNQLRTETSKYRQAVEDLDQHTHRLEVTKRELEVKSEAVQLRGQEQLEIEVAESYQSYESQEIDWPAIESQINELRGKIQRLGTINLDAIDEQEELEATCEQLGGQVKDIETAADQLRQLIRQINDDSRKRFEAIFEQLRENFAGRDGLFRRLFGGGRADLILVPDEEGRIDVLESGIDIIAKPPGKEPQSISLLSGGEKTMTAVALLMSIFKAKPSSFCVLDEVDAALDEANLERFTQVVRGFLDRAHFIIITHQKRTMQAADQLYGITMPQRGVSKHVSVRFEQVGDEGQIDEEATRALEAPSSPEPQADEAEAGVIPDEPLPDQFAGKASHNTPPPPESSLELVGTAPADQHEPGNPITDP